MKMGSPVFKKGFHQNPFVVFIHGAPFVLGLLFVEAHVVAHLSEQELSALPHGLLGFQRMRVHSGCPRRQLRCQLPIALAACPTPDSSCSEFVGGESDRQGGGEQRANLQSHLDRSMSFFSFPLPSLSESKDCGGGGPCMFPINRCKTIHLVRHGQGIHNVEGDKNYNAYMKPEYFDAHLTSLGWKEVDNLRNHVHDSGLMKRIDLVITSPLLRTLQTAVGVFGGEGYTDRTDVLPLMVENAGNSGRAAISSLNCPPIIAVELCREHLGVRPCDKRRSISEYQSLFPAIDFSLIDSNEDTWWKADVRETKEEIAARGLKFMNWLGTRKEKEIAIVTHRAFLFHTIGAFGNYSHPLEKEELSKPFANCELRSVVVVDW